MFHVLCSMLHTPYSMFHVPRNQCHIANVLQGKNLVPNLRSFFKFILLGQNFHFFFQTRKQSFLFATQNHLDAINIFLVVFFGNRTSIRPGAQPQLKIQTTFLGFLLAAVERKNPPHDFQRNLHLLLAGVRTKFFCISYLVFCILYFVRRFVFHS